ncbi:MAG: hypothetical protein BroJett012_06760 [Betaproteobacteria bacterium]|nr:MAG: hypothetical protein BroJett012_06760 [Betaproteobacteria bacterium]
MRRLGKAHQEMHSVSDTAMNRIYLTRHALERAAERAPGLNASTLHLALKKHGVEIDARYPSSERFILTWSIPDQKPILAVVSRQTNGVLTILDAWSDRGGNAFYSNVDGQQIIAGVIKRGDVRNACMKAGVLPPEKFISSPAPRTESSVLLRREFKLQVVTHQGKVLIKPVLKATDSGEAQLAQAIGKSINMLRDMNAKTAVLRLVCRAGKSGSPSEIGEWVLIGDSINVQ